MYLTREEERVYDGEYGWANQICMKILVSLGELFNASRLIPISSAHVSGVSYKTLGDAPTDFLKALSDAEVKVKTRATLNPQSVDQEYLCKKLSENLCKKQREILEYYEKMGFIKSLTCTPYYLKTPEKGSHLAWAESSAVIYANSIIGAWTNREGGPSALAAAIIGKTPDYGVHQSKNRQPKILVKIEKSLQKEVEFGALGIFLGTMLKDKIPMIQGIKNAPKDWLKQLGAALASTGMVSMFCMENSKIESSELETISVESKDIIQTIEKLTTTSTTNPDLVFIGCPHCSLEEIQHISKLIGEKKVKSGTKFWVCTSRYVKEKARKEVEKIERSGGHILTDTCAVVTWTDKLEIRTIMTNSAKTAHYAPTLNNAETILAPLKKCIETALQE